MRAWKRLLLTALLTFGLIGALLGLRWPYGYLAARHWQQELGRVSDDRAAVVLRQAAARAHGSPHQRTGAPCTRSVMCPTGVEKGSWTSPFRR